jgi:tetratricopeptide (TPR) repeat protein
LRNALAVGLLTLTVWMCVLDGPYRFDDHLVPLGDPASQSLAALSDHLTFTLRPLTKLTYALEASVGLADSAPARRAVSVVIHAVGAVLLALLLAHIADDTRWGLLALVWALHPVHAEAMLAVSGRSAALSTGLVLAALFAQLRARPLLAALLLLAAALARETAIAAALPLVALAAAASDRAARGSRRSGPWPPLLATLAAALWVVSVPRYRELAEFSFLGRPWAESVVAQVAAIPQGLALYLRTDLLSADHGTALPVTIASPGFWLGVGCLAAVSAGTLLAVRRGAVGVSVGLALWLAAIVPTQTLVPKLDPLTERPLGLALAGIVIAAVCPLVAASCAIRARTVLAAGSALVIFFATATVARGRLYASDVALWADAAHKSVTNPRPHVNLGVALVAAGRSAAARDAFRAALRIDPLDIQAERALAYASREDR